MDIDQAQTKGIRYSSLLGQSSRRAGKDEREASYVHGRSTVDYIGA